MQHAHIEASAAGGAAAVTSTHELDDLDVALIRAMQEHPRAGALELSRVLRVARFASRFAPLGFTVAVVLGGSAGRRPSSSFWNG